MEILYRYYILIAKWPIFINVYGAIENKNEYFGECKKLCHRIYLDCENTIFCGYEGGITQKERNLIKGGILKIEDKILQSMIHDDIVIIINKIEFNECFYQEEALPVAIMNWGAKAFEFEMVAVTCKFEIDNNKYIFEY